MRHSALLIALALGACATAPPDRVFAVFFTEQSTELDAPAIAVIARAAAIARQHPGRVVHVGGYADTTAGALVTLQLSRQRADVVAAQLQADGVPAAVIARSAIGVPPDSQPGVERRRVEIDIDLP